MNSYLVSLLRGLAVGVAYGLVQVRSPAPPLIALVGLLGMVLGGKGGRRDETPLRAAHLLRIFRAEATATWQEAVAAA
jgi:XapX domain-containing protein